MGGGMSEDAVDYGLLIFAALCLIIAVVIR